MSWKALIDRIHSLFPISETLIFSEKNLTPNVFERLIHEGKLFAQWSVFREWEDFDDKEIRERVIPREAFVNEDLYVVNEHTYSSNGQPQLVNSSHLAGFIDGYLDNHGECFFNGDVIIVSKDKGSVFIFSHEGAYTLIKKQ